MTKSLFLFTIGPVQSFIAQARKTQDLYAGSFLISRLCETAARKFLNDYNGKIIFPSDISAESIPNRFIGELEVDEKNLKKIGEAIEKGVRDKFRDIAFRALEKYDKTIFDRQIEPFLEIYWTFQPLKDYQKDYESIERTLGAIKNIRNFSRIPEMGRKCSLCGERNVLFYRLTDEEKKNGGLRVRRDGLPRKLYVKREDVVFYEPENKGDELKIQKGEGLCVVCYAKRTLYKYNFNNYDDSFPSTSNIVLYHTFTQLQKDPISKNYDAQGILALKDGKQLNKNKFEHIKETKEIYDKLKSKKIKVSDYYALLTFDGDHMGQWLSGKFLRDKDRLEDFHIELSKKLIAFGKWAKDYIEGKEKDTTKKGRSVYAGGDDFMGFVCLDYLLLTLKTLRDEFKIQVNDIIQKKFPADKELTFSAGIAIAHYKTPLSEALKWARNMEKEAKEKGGRDAFAIAILKHSGEIQKTIFKWIYGDSSTIEILENLVESFKVKKVDSSYKADFSDTFFRNLGTEFMQLMDKDGKYSNKPLVKTEIKRLIKRSCMIERRRNEDKNKFGKRKNQEINNLADKLNILYTNSKSLTNFISALSVAEFIERGGAI